ncbi:hypothetical protein [Bacillus pseudomycoides]|uniref:hypothetical protein n=1 Tax=Bacillus pseudomycoides TaxID=64104 RepID=UPI000BECF14E|nr:hypothetical protein [Bacillus pseudomycoides]PEB38530.1 hypothetical protein COO06_28020 [Bacillus pseudomycoides]PGD91575.1 hypothetical protein COM50_23175 [Bacillus pseudomycoides]
MKNIMRELNVEELEKHKGGIDITQGTHADGGDKGGGHSCRELFICWKLNGPCDGLDWHTAFLAYSRRGC